MKKFEWGGEFLCANQWQTWFLYEWYSSNYTFIPYGPFCFDQRTWLLKICNLALKTCFCVVFGIKKHFYEYRLMRAVFTNSIIFTFLTFLELEVYWLRSGSVGAQSFDFGLYYKKLNKINVIQTILRRKRVFLWLCYFLEFQKHVHYFSLMYLFFRNLLFLNNFESDDNVDWYFLL